MKALTFLVKFCHELVWKILLRNLKISAIRGRTFDPEGGGGAWQIWSGQIIYFHHRLGRKIHFRVNRGRQNIYFQPQQFFEKAKKKKKRGGGGGGVLVRGFCRGGRTWLSMF